MLSQIWIDPMGTFRQKAIYVGVVSAVVLLIIISITSRKRIQREHIFSKVLMGTLVEITISGAEGDALLFANAAEEAFAEISRLEEIFSSYKSTSDVSRVSASAGRVGVKVSPEVIEVVETALQIAKLSEGAFDPTIGALKEVWSFSGETKPLPKKERVAKLLKRVDYSQIYVDNDVVGIREAWVKMNLGGVAKGYIVGRAVEVLKARGAMRGIVKAGGDMFVFSDDGSEFFEIGILHPRKKGEMLGTLKLKSGAIATSGDYERFFMAGGVKYHHILDPATGFPARRSISATVTSIDPTLADALSTAVFVMGPESGLKMIESLEGVEGVIVAADGTLYQSSGMKGADLPERIDINEEE
jgi:thiamine biosynthesis lipoprotein